jgi:hypothetical protein
MRCSQNGCEFRPVFRYTWPGRDEAGVCGVHAVRLAAVAAAMGLHLQLIPLDDAEVTP